jgi:hypothetical protein
MGYSAQVQESPNQQSVQSSGKSGPIGQLVQQTVDRAPRAPDQQNPIGITQDQQNGIDSGAPRQAMGKGGNYSMSATSGQPRVGQPNLYPNTVGMGDNRQQQPNQAQAKGKGV